MADKDLIKLHEEIKKAIKEDAKIWRREFSDIQAHHVTMEIKAVTKQAMEEMARREGYANAAKMKKEVPIAVKELKEVIKGPIKTFLAKYYAEVKKSVGKNKTYDVTITGTPTNFSFAVHQAVKGAKANIFKNFIKKKKVEPQRPLVAAINRWSDTNSRRGTKEAPLKDGESKYIRSQGAPETGLAAGDPNLEPWERTKSNDSFTDFGHIGDSAVGTQRALAAADFLQNYTGKGADKVLKALQKTFKFILEDSKSYKGDMEKVLEVTLESSRMNKATMSKGEVTSLQKIINEALGMVAKKKDGKLYWVFREGSDSFFDMIEKTSVAAFAKGLKPNGTTKRIKTKVKYKKRKDSQNKKNGKETKRKVKVKKGPRYVIPPISTRKEAKAAMEQGPAHAPLAMIGLINKELPAAVEGNMGRPRLESITGRLAGSARITNIITTPQGYPSLGYTYQLSPYQTFEPGGNQGSSEYDPRTLIDQSIRSVAAKFAMGRLYTRRVS
tara:strand:+ start:155 stop:1648 length:1494 start_codon:yes stop_codon:yes gene_type:complete